MQLGAHPTPFPPPSVHQSGCLCLARILLTVHCRRHYKFHVHFLLVHIQHTKPCSYAGIGEEVALIIAGVIVFCVVIMVLTIVTATLACYWQRRQMRYNHLFRQRGMNCCYFPHRRGRAENSPGNTAQTSPSQAVSASLLWQTTNPTPQSFAPPMHGTESSCLP